MWRERTKVLVGENGIHKLENSKVAIIGVGGVGGYVCEMLARAGIGNLTIVDFDVVDVTNINRQVVASTKTIGKNKTDVMKSIILNINPKCNIKAINQRFTADFSKILFDEHFDYVVDAIDSVADKIELICFCKHHKINIVSACGAGNRMGVPNFKIIDIYKTCNDGLAKVMRKKLRERKIESLDVAICDEKQSIFTDKKSGSIGSISYYPAMCGCVLSAFVVQNLLKD